MSKRKRNHIPPASKLPDLLALGIIFFIGTLLGATSVWAFLSSPYPTVLPALPETQPSKTEVNVPVSLEDLTLDELVKLPDSELAKVDIAQVDLLCATGLPGSENIDIKACLEEIDEWTAHCREETEKNMYRYFANPSAYHSEWIYRVKLMDTIMKEDFKIHYDENHPDSESNHDFFRTSSHLFINGLLSPNRNGSCSSMPVLLVAIGRRLGYPLFLVSCRNHFFARWDDRRDRFNILNSNDTGMGTAPDSYFRTWPFPMTDEMIQNNGYLKSMGPRQQLAELLINRGACLHENGRIGEAIEVAKIGHRLMPTNTAFITKS